MRLIRRYDPARVLARVVAVAVSLCGLALIAQGAWIPAKAMVAQVLLERAFAEAQAAGEPVKPWPWADSWPVARVTVPRLGVSVIVMTGGSGEAMAFGPALLPRAGAVNGAGTAVFAAHRDTHFRFLQYLRPGDRLAVESAKGGQAVYRVTEGFVVRRDEFGIDATPPRPRLALVTCWPFDALHSGPLRYVVEAELVDNSREKA